LNPPDAFADTYDPKTSKLLISKVSVGTRSYCNVVATIGSVVSVGAPPANGIGDQFDPATGRLTIPSLRVGDKTYNNVVVTLSNVLNAEVLPDYLSGGTLHGYAALNVQESPPEFHYGFSLYTSIQKISDYQVKNLQFGWGTWLVPDNRANKLLCPLGTVMRNLYPNQGTFWSQFQTIEGGGRGSGFLLISPQPFPSFVSTVRRTVTTMKWRPRDMTFWAIG